MVIVLQSWTATGYVSNSTGSYVTNCRFSPIIVAKCGRWAHALAGTERNELIWIGPRCRVHVQMLVSRKPVRVECVGILLNVWVGSGEWHGGSEWGGCGLESCSQGRRLMHGWIVGEEMKQQPCGVGRFLSRSLASMGGLGCRILARHGRLPPRGRACFGLVSGYRGATWALASPTQLSWSRCRFLHSLGSWIIIRVVHAWTWVSWNWSSNGSDHKKRCSNNTKSSRQCGPQWFYRTHINFQLTPNLSKFKINVCHLECAKLMCHVNILFYSTFFLELIRYLNLTPIINLWSPKGRFTQWTMKLSHGDLRALIGCWSRPETTSVYTTKKMVEGSWTLRSPKYNFKA